MRRLLLGYCFVLLVLSIMQANARPGSSGETAEKGAADDSVAEVRSGRRWMSDDNLPVEKMKDLVEKTGDGTHSKN